MNPIKKLPDAEFDIMQFMWEQDPPITTTQIMEQIGTERGWKIQTVVTLMLRLSEKGFLRSEKLGKSRTYFPVISKSEYLKFEMDNFVGRFHNNSFSSLVASVYDGNSLSNDEIDELLLLTQQLKAQREV